MDKIILKEKDLIYILNWRDTHKDLVRQNVCPLSRIQIVCPDTGYTITGIRKGNELKLCLNQRGKNVGNTVYQLIENTGLYRTVKNKTKLPDEDRQSILTVYCSTMAFIVFGKETTMEVGSNPAVTKPKPDVAHSKSRKSTSKKKSAGITYILRSSNGTPYVAAQGSHSSPSVMFTVRGHYRHYKNGKVIWVSEYTKGKGKKHSTTYKIDNDPLG